MGQFTFRREERLKKEKDIQELFSKGSSFYLFPFKVLVKPTEGKFSKALFSVSKKSFPRAVDRNLLKRRIRESYRLQKNFLPAGQSCHIGIIYTHKEILSYQEISDKMVHVVKRIKRFAGQSVKQQ